jgi:hypothetical protein
MALCFLLLFSCRKKEEYTITTFSDGFENAQAVEDLLLPDKARFTDIQLSEEHGLNKISIDTIIVHSGNNSLRCEAKVSSSGWVSKASIIKNELDLREEDVVYVSVWYYLAPTVNTPDVDLYICDLEESTQTGGSPGFRIQLGNEGELEVERGKIGKPTIYEDNPAAFPQGQWVHLEYEAKLSKRNKGYIKVWQDGVLLIDKSDIQLLGRDKWFAMHGTRGSLDRLEVGITANGKDADQVLYVDDVFIQKR